MANQHFEWPKVTTATYSSFPLLVYVSCQPNSGEQIAWIEAIQEGEERLTWPAKFPETLLQMAAREKPYARPQSGNGRIIRLKQEIQS